MLCRLNHETLPRAWQTNRQNDGSFTRARGTRGCEGLTCCSLNGHGLRGCRRDTARLHWHNVGYIPVYFGTRKG